MVDHVVRASYQIDDGVSAKANAMGVALGEAAAQSEVLEKAVTRTGRSAQGFKNSLDPITAATRAVTIALRAQADAQAKLTEDMAKGGTTAEEFSRAMNGAAAKVDAARARLAAARATTVEATTANIDLARSYDRAASAQSSAQEKMNRIMSAAYIPARDREKDITATFGALDTLRAKYDPLFRVSKQYESALEGIAEAEKVGAISANVASAARDRETAAYQNLLVPQQKIVASSKELAAAHAEVGASAGQVTFAMRQLGVQTVQAISGIATGQPVMTTFIQQGHQVVDVALATGTGFSILTRGIGLVASAMLTPIGAAVSLVAAFGVLAYSAESQDRAFSRLSKRLQTTREDYKAAATDITVMSRQIAATGLLSETDAQTAGATIGGARGFNGNVGSLRELIALSADVAKAFDEDIAAASGRVAAALKAPKDAAQAFADQGLKSMDQALADTIARMQNAGRFEEAQAATLRALRAATEGAADSLTPLQRALRDVEGAFSGSTTGGVSFAHAIGSALSSAAAMGLDAIAALMNGLNGAYKAVTDLRGGSSAPMSGVPVDIQEAITAASKRSGLDPQYIATLYALEAVRNKDGSFATSAAGARGPLQMLQGTFDEVAKKNGITGSIDDPATNILAGALYARSMIDRFGDTTRGTAAYNAGPAGDPTNPETAAYVRNFRSAYSGNAVIGPVVAPGARAPLPGDSGTVDRALVLAGSVGGTGQTVDKLNDTLDQLQAAQKIVQTGTPEWEKLQTAIEATRGALYNSGDAAQKFVRDAELTLAPLQAEDGAARALATAHGALEEASRSAGRETTLPERARLTAAEMEKLRLALRDTVAETDRNTAGLRAIAGAYADGAKSGADATNRVRAEAEARKFGVVGTQQYAVALAALTTAYKDNAAAAADVTTAQRNLSSADELAVMSKQLDLLFASTDVRERELAILKERQRLISSNANLDSAQSKEALANAARVSDATQYLARTRTALDELANVSTQAFDRIGSSITQAFANGGIKAINFGQIAKAALSEVVQYALKIAVLNPALNSVFGGSRSTLGDLTSALGQGGGSGGFNIPGLGGLGDNFSGLMNTTLWEGSGSIPLASAANTTLGSLLGGAGAGFGAGSLVNSLLGGNQIGGSIGSGAGGLAGAAIGSIIPGVGTLIGGLIGGGLGGGLGGLFGPGKKHHGWSYQVQGNGADGLGLGERVFVDPVAQAQFEAEKQQMAEINAYLKQSGVSVGGLIEVGGNNNNPNQVGSLNDGFNQFRFSASDSTLNTALSGRGFGDTQGLQAAVSFVESYKALIDDSNIGSVQTAVDALTKSFGEAITTAQGYGLATEKLTAVQDKQVAAVRAAVAAQVTTGTTSLQARLLNATGRSAEANSLLFEDKATNEIKTWSDQLTGFFGDAYKSSSDYADKMALLNNTLDAERKKVTDSFNDTGRSGVAGVASNLAAFARSLQTGSASPLSPQGQYAAAASGFRGIAARASSGDFGALQQVQSYGSDFLSQSRNLNGSGAQYAADVKTVADLLAEVAVSSPDTLTASAMAQIQQTATEQMVTAIAELKIQVAALTLQLQHAAAAP